MLCQYLLGSVGSPLTEELRELSYRAMARRDDSVGGRDTSEFRTPELLDRPREWKFLRDGRSGGQGFRVTGGEAFRMRRFTWGSRLPVLPDFYQCFSSIRHHQGLREASLINGQCVRTEQWLLPRITHTHVCKHSSANSMCMFSTLSRVLSHE
ncbi:hypothetical protein J6590_043765 [Homalodisca vitripennis]|nr:hypothetical protein J6590_043765 [Homalodisca vitripennis]